MRVFPAFFDNQIADTRFYFEHGSKEFARYNKIFDGRQKFCYSKLELIEKPKGIKKTKKGKRINKLKIKR
jgi:hypothetical protein